MMTEIIHQLCLLSPSNSEGGGEVFGGIIVFLASIAGSFYGLRLIIHPDKHLASRQKSLDKIAFQYFSKTPTRKQASARLLLWGASNGDNPKSKIRLHGFIILMLCIAVMATISAYAIHNALSM